MRTSKFISQPFRSHLLIIIMAVILMGVYLYCSLSAYLMSQSIATLKTNAALISLQVSQAKNINALTVETGKTTGLRVTVIDAQGNVLGDSIELPQHMENHKNRTEFASALAGTTGVAVRKSTTTKQPALYVAIPVISQGKITGAVRTAKPIAELDAKRGEMQRNVILFSLAILIVLAVISFFTSKQYSKPLQIMGKKAHKFAAGEFHTRMEAPKSGELAVLAQSFNYMADTIQKRMAVITSQRNNLNVILNSMTDAVIAVKNDERILEINPAAEKWLGLTRVDVEGRYMREVIRYSALQDFILAALNTHQPQAADLTVFLDDEHVINAKSSPLYGFEEEIYGAVIVFDDVTKTRRLENLRRDFVSNVSHEIRTPLTAIKGSAEILQAALKNDAETTKFLNIINNHTDRLNDLINDLLLLSRIEQDSAELTREKTGVLAIINTVLNTLSAKIDAKRIEVFIDVPTNLQINVNVGLLEQALINLIDNAVKYSAPESTVEIIVNTTNDTWQIAVKDHGEGIPKKHLDRLFERFYRADDSRSRKIGGTGLGLAIVKHIARAHGGSVEVASAPHQGSTFTIILPNM